MQHKNAVLELILWPDHLRIDCALFFFIQLPWWKFRTSQAGNWIPFQKPSVHSWHCIYWHKVLAHSETATSALMGCTKTHSLYLTTQWNRWLNRWWKWAEQFLCVTFPEPCRALVTSSYHYSQEREQLCQKATQDTYNPPFTHSVLKQAYFTVSSASQLLIYHCSFGLWQMDGGRSGSGVAWKIRH